MGSSQSSKVKTWKENAAEILKLYYLCFRGSQYDEYMVGSEDEKLLLSKICFAIHGMPTNKDAKEIWDGYEKEQLKNANAILKLILGIHEAKNEGKKQLLVGIIFIACKQEKTEFVLPIFSVFTGFDPNNAHAPRGYVDTQLRTYESWADWKMNNRMPRVEYAYPRRGFFTSSKYCSNEFDPEKDPDIEFGTSPACDLSSRFLGATDIVASLTVLGCEITRIASMFTPIGQAVRLASFIGGGLSIVYGNVRAVTRLVDKGTHGESLTDFESFTLWFNIAASPIHIASLCANAQPESGATSAKGAQPESGATAAKGASIFSSTTRMIATVLNFNTLDVVDGIMFAIGLANMIEKKKKDQLTSLNILQFSISVFFFTNTLILPQIALMIIKNAQDDHIQNYVDSMSDADAKEIFNKFLKSNEGYGSIKGTSKIIRAINRTENPNEVFGNLKDTSDIKIDGRKENTLLVSDQSQNTTRINPSKIISNMARQMRMIKVMDKKYENIQKTIDKIFSGQRSTKISLLQSFVELYDEVLALTKIEVSLEVQELVEVFLVKLEGEHPKISISQTEMKNLSYVNSTNFTDEIQKVCNIALLSHSARMANSKDKKTNKIEERRDCSSCFPAELKIANVRKELEPSELVNIDTDRVLGGLYKDVSADILRSNGSTFYEVNHAPPTSCYESSALTNSYGEQLAFVMIKEDHSKHHTTGSRLEAQMIRLIIGEGMDGAFARVMKEEINFLDENKILPKYSVGVLQWIEKALETRHITKDGYIEVLKHFLALLENCQQNRNYTFEGIGIIDKGIETLFNKLKGKISLKIFVMRLIIVIHEIRD